MEQKYQTTNRRVGPSIKECYFVFQADFSGDMNAFYFDEKDEALDFIQESDYCAYLLCVDYAGDGWWNLNAEPHT